MSTAVAELVAGVRQDGLDMYKLYVLQSAMGDDNLPQPIELSEALRDVEKTPDDFERDVNLVKARRQAVADLEESARLEEEKLEEVNELFAIALQDHDDIRAECDAKMETAMDQLQSARDAATSVGRRIKDLRINSEATLRRTADPGIGEAVSRLQASRRQLEEQLVSGPVAEGMQTGQDRIRAEVAKIDREIFILEVRQLERDSFAL